MNLLNISALMNTKHAPRELRWTTHSQNVDLVSRTSEARSKKSRPRACEQGALLQVSHAPLHVCVSNRQS